MTGQTTLNTVPQPTDSPRVGEGIAACHHPKRGIHVPAARSRTEHWRDCLQKLFERDGALEVSVDRSGDGNTTSAPGADVAWRCRILGLTDSHITIEPPAAFGASLRLDPGVAVIGAMTIGQNRWMFRTTTVAAAGSATRGVTLAMPERVERCTRRGFFRISTASLHLPRVQCWPLIDPTSVVAAEASNRAEITDLLAGKSQPMTFGPADSALSEPSLLPTVGPAFKASLLNVSGGGLGLLVAPEDTAALSTRPYLWLRLDLRPHIPAPAAVTARVAHTHIDSTQSLYAGMAFDFAHNPPHREFIVDLFTRYVESLQRQQRQVVRAAA